MGRSLFTGVDPCGGIIDHSVIHVYFLAVFLFLFSWKQRQAARVKKRGVEESNDVSAVSLHSSKTISEKELSRMLAVNKKDSRLIYS